MINFNPPPAFKNVVLLLVLSVLPFSLQAQADASAPRYRAGIYYGFGLIRPMGSFSAGRNNDYNQLGRASAGLNIKGGVEWFVTKNNALSLDLEGGFCSITNDSLDQRLKRRLSSSGTDYSVYGGLGSEVTMGQVSIGYSHLFRFKRLLVQPKIGIGLGFYSYYYDGVFTTSLMSWTTSAYPETVRYTTKDYFYLTIKPELDLKYILKEGRVFDYVLGGSASYVYARPEVDLVEEKAGKTTVVMVIKDRIRYMNYSVFFNLILKL